MTSGPGPGEFPRFWVSMVIRDALIPRKGSGKQQQQKQHAAAYYYLHALLTIVGNGNFKENA